MVTICVVLIAFMVYLELEIPGYMSGITTQLNMPVPDMDAIYHDGWMMVICAFGSLIISVIVGAFASYIASSLARTLRELEFAKVLSFSAAEINGFSTASLITRSTNDITQIQMTTVMGLMIVIRAPIMAAWAIIKIMDKNWEWSMATLIAVLVVISTIGILMIYVIPRFRRIQGLTDDVNRVTRENLNGIRVVRAYNAEDYQERKFEDANEDLTTTNLSANRAMAVMYPVMLMVMNGLTLAIYWIGASLIHSAGPGPEALELFSDMVVFSSYAMQIVMAFVMMVVILMILPRAMVASKRVQGVINTEPSIRDGECSEGTESGTVEFRNVSFRYSDAGGDVLRNVSFKASKGETVAFIGATGSGKTTLADLIPRFYDATEGEVLVDGRNVKDYRISDLRSKLGYVSQKAFMFKGTIESNVNYGDTSSARTEADVKRAVNVAQADGFVESMPGGYGGDVAQGGTNLSGGQKQRLSIARAVCRDPEIYIFDDTFSALDYRTDRTLRMTLKEEIKGATTLIVAQRIGTIMDADKIIVIKDGGIVGIGRHEELLSTCQEYLDIARSQLSEEELGL
ncbi:MAG: ABC transporter ATP-binding protein [Candidatus Methanomethylophilaceae archaeon]